MQTAGEYRSQWRVATVASVCAAALGISGVVAGLPGGGSTAEASGLQRFSGCPELERYARDAALPQVTAYGLNPGGAVARSSGAAAAQEGSAAVQSAPRSDTMAAPGEEEASTGPAVGVGATGTNVQEAGVDEPDLVKTDGRHLVTVTGGALRVVDTAKGADGPVGRLSLPGGHVNELLLVGNRALLLGSGSTHDDPVPPSHVDVVPLPRPLTTARVTLVDLSDPADPQVLSTADMDGAYVTAREHGGVVRLVLSSTPALPLRYATAPGTAKKDALAYNRRAVRGLTAEDLLPGVVVRDADGRTVRDETLVRCGDVHHPGRVAGLGTVSVVTLDPAQGLQAMPATAVTSSTDHVYATASRLYVTTGAWGQSPGPIPLGGDVVTDSAGGGGGVAGIDGTGGDVAVDSTGRSIAPRIARPSTALHAFDLTGGGPAAYVASGRVDGSLLGRWAMSEHEGLLRVATTRSGVSGSPSGMDNQVVVLDERGDRLVRIGRVGGLGPGESIRSVRWFGDLATVVTFRQTDPLYTVDLSDPRHPRVRGELKIPGFSAYLHPAGDGLLLGVGQDATAQGQVTGLQVSSFDLSDLDDPRRTDAVDLGQGWSPVMDDSRAFTYLPEQRLALVPVETWSTWGSAELSDEPSVARPAMGGVVAVRVGEHGALETLAWLGQGTQVLRAIPVGGQIALVGPASAVLVDADTLAETGRVSLA
ncbi:MAG: beta-propeller domain-containing protein [Actinomycetes bacterium]